MDRREFFVVVAGAACAALAADLVVATPSPFDLFLAEINRRAEQDGAVDLGKRYADLTGHECWREMFNDGLTAQEAWREECWAAAEMLG